MLHQRKSDLFHSYIDVHLLYDIIIANHILKYYFNKEYRDVKGILTPKVLTEPCLNLSAHTASHNHTKGKQGIRNGYETASYFPNEILEVGQMKVPRKRQTFAPLSLQKLLPNTS